MGVFERLKHFFIKEKDENTEVKEEKNDVVQDNTSEYFSSIGTTIIDSVKIAMATLLSIFVPQFCPETGTTCTLSDNFSDLTSFNRFVIGWNFISLCLFVYLAKVQNKRETYFIDHLDQSKKLAFDSLSDNCKEYPRILRRVKDHNKKLIFWSKLTMVSFIINVLVSCILVFHYYYDGFRTATTLIANVLLVSSKLYYCIKIGNESNGIKLMALSTIKTEPASYNVIDRAYKKDKKIKGTYNLSVKIDPYNLMQYKYRKDKRDSTRFRSKSVDSSLSVWKAVLSDNKIGVDIKNISTLLQTDAKGLIQALKAKDINLIKETGLNAINHVKDNIEVIKEDHKIIKEIIVKS